MVPAISSATDLATMMHGRLGRVALALALVNPTSYEQAIIDTLIAYGVSDLSEVTDANRLRALATVEAWRLAVVATAPRVNESTDGRRLDRAAFHDHCLRMYEDAMTTASQYPGDGSGSVLGSAGRVAVRYCDRYS